MDRDIHAVFVFSIYAKEFIFMQEDIKKEATEESEKKENRKVANGRKTKKSFIRSVKESFIAEEAADLKEYLIHDVIVPTVKKAIVEGVQDGIAMIFGMDPVKRKDYDRGYNRVRYSASYDRHEKERSREREDRRSTPYRFDELIFDTKDEAMEVLELMDEALDRYERVSIADMYEFAGESNTPEDYNYGWTNLNSAKIVRNRDGDYVLEMPRAKCIK